MAGFVDYLRMSMGWWSRLVGSGDKLCGIVSARPSLGGEIQSRALRGVVAANVVLSSNITIHAELGGNVDHSISLTGLIEAST